ncbi:MAG: methionine--tRNA ligase [Candidatus Omnitrophota bacterium]|nr:MAG: methionine--tRNA ligase [Candidatus Omnitrophota bacterium]
MSKFYITTPIYYVNASPHIGHAYTSIICDCMARFKRLGGEQVYYLTGTDEHGEKVNQAAKASGEDVSGFVDRVVGNFKKLWKDLDVSYDFFIRTTQNEHKEVVRKVITLLHSKGDIYKAKYQGFYCMPCESFWTPTQVKDAGGVCALCKREVEKIEEENYFFKLSKYEGWLKSYLKKNPSFIQPKTRYNEVKGFLDNNVLADLCISRPKSRVSWGVEFPLDASYVVYVWFDALINYISAVGYGSDDDKFKQWWPADLHLIGKDILRHHAIFWPVMLHALGVSLPRVIFAHGWWKVEEEKMSKSKGNIVNPYTLIKDVGTDALRYFLLREISPGADGNFSYKAVVNRINSDLANDLGNLVYRTLNMAQKYFDGKVTARKCSLPAQFKKTLAPLAQNYAKYMDSLNFPAALDLVFAFVRVMNKYIEDTKPWALWKEKETSRIEEFLYALLEGIRIVSVYLYPFMPAAAQAILRQLGLKEELLSLRECKWAQKETYSIKKEKPLFPRIDVD